MVEQKMVQNFSNQVSIGKPRCVYLVDANFRDTVYRKSEYLLIHLFVVRRTKTIHLYICNKLRHLSRCTDHEA